MKFPKSRKRKDKNEAIISSTLPIQSIPADSEFFDSRNDDDDIIGPAGLNLLYSPLEPIVDFIFVHGLGGGSRKTWSRTSSLEHFWPKEWLPKDPAFKDVRIHSFGYNSCWTSGKKDAWDIDEFGESLLGRIGISPEIAYSSTPIILIGHSMGGLVIKKAYILGRKEKKFEDIAKRFHTIIFLATPHRGSSPAKSLSRMLEWMSRGRRYINDLIPGSDTLRLINEEFVQYYGDLNFLSFYEMLELSKGPFSKMIVEKESAVLGCDREKKFPLNADHRSICKFDTTADDNYKTIRNAFAQELNNMLISGTALFASTSDKTSRITRPEAETLGQDRFLRNQVESIERYLEIPQSQEETLLNLAKGRLSEGRTEFTARQTYLNWKNHKSGSPRIFWVYGLPGSGKSVLSSYLVDRIRQTGEICSYFFFRCSDAAKSTLVYCLRSLALQMAMVDERVRNRLLKMQNEDIILDMRNLQAIWRELFQSSILQIKLKPQFWIIDGLDECNDILPFFNTVLSNVAAITPLRIMIVSRDTKEIRWHFDTFGPRYFQSEDIIPTNLEPNLRHTNENSFEHILEQTLLGLQENEITKAIFLWMTCAFRPLKTEELDAAITLEVGRILPNAQEMISSSCANLIYTSDKTVYFIHSGIKAFLLREGIHSTFAVDIMEGNTRIVKTCLSYLTREEMRPPRVTRRDGSRIRLENRSAFFQYAATTIHLHLLKARSSERDIVLLTHSFLKSNVLCWVEALAYMQDLASLIQAAENLEKYVQECDKTILELDEELLTIRSWAIDLLWVTNKFSQVLTLLPSAIYSLIPTLCPTSSMIHNVKIPGRKLAIAGLLPAVWEDHLACLNYQSGRTTSICYGVGFLAVGLTTGKIHLYRNEDYSEYKILDHGEAVIGLQFKDKSETLASYGNRTIQVWDIRSGQTIHKFQAPSRPFDLKFDGSLIIMASRMNVLMSWDLDNNGIQKPDRLWSDSTHNETEQPRRVLSALSISFSHNILAAYYHNQPITLWDLEANAYLGTCGKKETDGRTSTHPIFALLMNPNPNMRLLVASYMDGKLVLLDPIQDEEIESTDTVCHQLASSPDGGFFAAGCGSGIIRLYVFDTLRLVHQVDSHQSQIQQIAFSMDGSHFADIRGAQCNIWKPSKSIFGSPKNFDYKAPSAAAPISQSALDITAVTPYPGKGVLFCGDQNGSVSLYDLKTGAYIRTLYSHQASVRTLILWSHQNMIMSADISNNIYMWDLKNYLTAEFDSEKTIFKSHVESLATVHRIVQGEMVGKCVISTRESDHLWNIFGRQERERKYQTNSIQTRIWIQHPQSSSHLICLNGPCVHVFAWEDWSEILSLSIDINLKGLEYKDAFLYQTGATKEQILIELAELFTSGPTRELFLLDTSCFSIDPSLRQSENPELEDHDEMEMDEDVTLKLPRKVEQPLFLFALTRHMAHAIGFAPGTRKLIFRDTRSWICSIDFGRLMKTESSPDSPVSFQRHFYVPPEWLAGKSTPVCSLLQCNVIFARTGSLIIVQNGLDFAESFEL